MKEQLMQIILEYESDTFYAAGLEVTQDEARQITQRLFDRLCALVENGAAGTPLTCDGDQLADLLEEIRES